MSIHRALTNLVDNTLKHGGGDLGEIRGGYEEKKDCHVIYVQDDGRGLQGDDAKAIFGPFVKKTSISEGEGTGLGLAVVKEIAEQHRGKVWPEPAKERGITFYLSIAKDI